jgi:hypothetical protein
MLDSILKIIRSKNRRQWREVILRLLELARETLRTNGELSALVGIIFGILIVLLFKWILFFAVLLALIFWAVLMIAPEE